MVRTKIEGRNTGQANDPIEEFFDDYVNLFKMSSYDKMEICGWTITNLPQTRKLYYIFGRFLGFLLWMELITSRVLGSTVIYPLLSIDRLDFDNIMQNYNSIGKDKWDGLIILYLELVQL